MQTPEGKEQAWQLLAKLTTIAKEANAKMYIKYNKWWEIRFVIDTPDESGKIIGALITTYKHDSLRFCLEKIISVVQDKWKLK